MNNCCFPAGSIIICERGHLKIEDVQPGERVLCWNEQTHKQEMGVASSLGVFQRDNMCTITFSDGFLLTTNDHPLMSQRGWASISPHNTLAAYGTEALKLEVGDYLFTDKLIWKEIIDIDVSWGEVTTYSLVDVSLHNFYVANGGPFILAHNRGGDTPIVTTHKEYVQPIPAGATQSSVRVEWTTDDITWNLLGQAIGNGSALSHLSPLASSVTSVNLAKLKVRVSLTSQAAVSLAPESPATVNVFHLILT